MWAKGLQITSDFLPLHNEFDFHANNHFAGEGAGSQTEDIFHFGRKLFLPAVSQAAAKSSQAYCTLPATGHNATAA